MSWINKRLPFLLTLSIVIFLMLIFSLNTKIKASHTDNKVAVETETAFFATASPEPTDSSTKKLATIKTPTNKPTASNKPTTTTQENNNTGSTNNENANNTTTTTTTAPIVATINPTSQPTTTPEVVNIQIWVRAWQYNNNQQYATDGSVKIKKNGQEIASGSVNGDIIYKASNMPTNSNLEIYFYFSNGCGQMKQISTGSNSTLFQEDFSLSSTTICL